MTTTTGRASVLPASDLRTYLLAVVALQGGRPSVERFLLEHGRPWTIDALTFTGRRMTRKQCYANCQRRILTDNTVAYCEGLVSLDGLPIAHAWLVDCDGNVDDPTIREDAGRRVFRRCFRHRLDARLARSHVERTLTSRRHRDRLDGAGISKGNIIMTEHTVRFWEIDHWGDAIRFDSAAHEYVVNMARGVAARVRPVGAPEPVEVWAREAAKAGALFLDEKASGWEAVAQDAIDAGRFDMQSSDHCVLGENYGDYFLGVTALGFAGIDRHDRTLPDGRTAYNLGFEGRPVFDRPYADTDEEYDALNAAWKAEIAARL